MITVIILLIIGLIILVSGAEALVRGASSLASKWKIPALVIGLTIVAIGTSVPELIINIASIAKGGGDIGIGNIIGSNIANILLILGITAIIAPIKYQKSTVWKEIPFAFGAVILFYLLGNNVFMDGVAPSSVTRLEGMILLILFIGFIFYAVRLAKRSINNNLDDGVTQYSYPISIILVLAGLILLFYGGNLLVSQAIILAKLAGLSQAMIGLTIISIGTSLPELATSVVAAVRKQNDLAIGNILGSNIINILLVFGLTSVISPVPWNPRFNIDIIIVLGATFLLFLAAFTGKKSVINRGWGVTLLSLYFLYVSFLILRGF